MPDPQTVAAFNELVKNLAAMDLPRMVTLMGIVFIVAPVIITVVLGRIVMKFLNSAREGATESSAQLGVALSLAGQSSQNVELLRQSLDKLPAEVSRAMEAFMSKVQQDIEATKRAILEKIATVRDTLGDLSTQIEAGFDKATLVSDDIQLGVARLGEGQQALLDGMGKLLDSVAKRGNLDDAMLDQIQQMAGQIGTLSENIAKLLEGLEKNEGR